MRLSSYNSDIVETRNSCNLLKNALIEAF